MSYIEEAHARAQRRKSPWNLLLIPTFATACGFLWWSFARLVERLHQSIYPSESITHATGAGAIVASVAPFFAAIPLAFIVANAMVWLVPPARRALNHEAQGHPGTTFRQSQQQLLAISKLLVPIALTIAAVGVVFLESLTVLKRESREVTIEVWLTNRCKGLGPSYGFEKQRSFAFKGPCP